MLPAAATTRAPELVAYVTASQTVREYAVEPRLTLITRAPESAAQMIPLATAATLPLPDASSTFTGITGAVKATPAPPARLFAAAAAMPATCVPCP